MAGIWGGLFKPIRRSAADAVVVPVRRPIKTTLMKLRAYAGAVTSRLTTDWKPASVSADYDVYAALRTLRGRARDLCQNNDYAKKYLLLARMNICGPNGFKFQADVREDGGTSDLQANKKIEEAWADWSKMTNCTVTGLHSLRQVQDLAVRHLVRDGEFVARCIRGKQYKYGFALQILEPDLLNETVNTTLDNGNVIVMGVEFDAVRRPVAYYFAKPVSSAIAYQLTFIREHERVPAADVFHVYDADRCMQSRGVSWYAASMYRLRMLTGYEDATLSKARAAATTGGFFTSETGAEYTGPEQDPDGNQIMPLEPGEWVTLPAGVKATSIDPNFPSTSHEPFIKGTLRGIASGLGVAYSSLANDLADVNYSSIRAGIVEERDVWRYNQGIIVERFLAPLYERWLESALLSGNLNLPFSKFDKFNRPVFTGRRWAWVDPLNDVQAEVAQVDAGFKTRTEIIAERGENIEDVYRELSEEKKLAAKYGLKNLNGVEENGPTKPEPATAE
jgi:lambda family phage portal protein